ncbi:hypothetical protein PC9H_000477 [Pleurotus ostreatus]|uniref:Choice-of-anchor B family protein n=1 Tax=Pleurotus ostreatus TaxID=5322 RepID=A0A8H7A205_PLEOS|nr:uncharacterized protein PC9H_000477 [Pleurotus ostreatus]KAF7440133.1 hypothetical protein PC9H_000477 [Pleurotus ostreatus]KAJ8700598.1 hypothetical protein PTI98_003611 [Pleurotus ostreatus]
MARFLAFSLVFAAVISSAWTKEIRNPPRLQAYESGAVHNGIMDMKHRLWSAKEAAGAFNSARYSKIEDFTPCINGTAGEFRCNNIDLYSFYSHADLGSQTGQGSSSWGWVHEGREYIIIAQADGAAIAEVTADGKLDYLGRLPKTPEAAAAIWRELRVLDHWLIVGSEAVNHHVQIFDLRKILEITPEEKPKTFDPRTDITGLFKGLPVGRTHNIVINWDRGYVVSVGSQPRTSEFAAGLVFIDISDPSKPALAGFQADDGYVHDAQCLIYRGPDTRYVGQDVCYGYNEDTLTIYNVTDTANASIISRTGYEGASYTHQGWVLDPEWQQYLILDDELDEVNGAGAAADGNAVTYIWDVSDLENPKQTGLFKTPGVTIDHNQYIANGKVYQSNYGAGLRIVDISSIPTDPTGGSVKEVGFFDIYPEDDARAGGGALSFVGSWSSYGLFPSGNIIINTIERGAYVVRIAEE